MGLRKKISIVTLLITISAIFITATLGYYFNYALSKKYINESMTYESNLITSDVATWITKKTEVISLLGKIIEKNDMSKAEIHKLLRNLKMDSEISDIYMGFEDGSFISAIGWPPPAGYNPTIRPWYKNAYKSSGVVFSEPYLDMTTGEYAVSIGTRVVDQKGHLIGIVAEDILVETLFQRLSNIKFKNIGYVFMISSSGYLLAHPDKTIINTDLTQNPELKELIGNIKRMKNGVLEYNYKKTDKRVVFKEIPASKWIVGVTVPKKSMYLPLQQLGYQYLLLFVCITAASVLIAYKSAKTITVRIKNLLNKTIRISRGHYSELIEVVGDDEIAELSESFNIMAHNVQTSVSELDRYNTQLQDMVDHAVKQVEIKQKQLLEAEKISSLSYLVSGVAHEMNTPMGNCIMLTSFIEKESELIEKQVGDATVKRSDLLKYVSEIKESSHRIMGNLEVSRDLINDFKELSVSKLSDVAMTMDIEELVQSNFNDVSAQFPNLKVELELTVEEDLEFKSEYTKVSKIFNELFSNSFAHGFEGSDEGRISVRIRQVPSGYDLVYQDNGIGVDETHMEKIFTPFFSTKFSNVHSGLGLNVVYNILVSLGGDIQLANRPTGGVEITMVI